MVTWPGFNQTNGAALLVQNQCAAIAEGLWPYSWNDGPGRTPVRRAPRDTLRLGVTKACNVILADCAHVLIRFALNRGKEQFARLLILGPGRRRNFAFRPVQPGFNESASGFAAQATASRVAQRELKGVRPILVFLQSWRPRGAGFTPGKEKQATPWVPPASLARLENLAVS